MPRKLSGVDTFVPEASDVVEEESGDMVSMEPAAPIDEEWTPPALSQDTANDAFDFLPDALHVVDNGQRQMAIPVAQGLHGCWVTYNPVILAEYEAMGVHISKVGDKTVVNESIFQKTPEQYLRNGDAVVGVMRESAYQDMLRNLHRKNESEAMEGGVARGKDRPAGFPIAG